MGAEQVPDYEQARITHLLPYLARDKYRAVESLGLLEAESEEENNDKSKDEDKGEWASVVSPEFNTRLSIATTDVENVWKISGWEDASLSGEGKFPEALASYSDGFEVEIFGGYLALYGMYSEDKSASPPSFAETIAIKDILWHAQPTYLPEPTVHTEAHVAELRRVEKNAVSKAQNAFHAFRDGAYLLDDLSTDSILIIDGHQPEESASFVAPYDNDKAQIDMCWARAVWGNQDIVAAMYFTPRELLDKTPPEKQVARLSVNAEQAFNFRGADGSYVWTQDFEIVFEPNDKGILLVPRENPKASTALGFAATDLIIRLLSELNVQPIYEDVS